MSTQPIRLGLLLLLALAAGAGEAFTATFTVSTAGGKYWTSKTRYVLACWVEGPASVTRIATIYGTTGEGTHLTQWKAKGGNLLAVDGVMGATLNASTQRTRTVTWDLTTPYKTGSTTYAPDGSYEIWLESVDANTPAAGTSSVTGANRFHFTFQHDGVTRSNVPVTDGGGKFTAITYGCTGRNPTTSNPALSISVGGSTTFTVTNNTTVAPSAYQWRKGGSNLAGATASTYTIAPAATGDAGSYDCVLTYPNTYGLPTAPTMTSNALTLVVTSSSVAATGSTITPATSTVNPGAAVTLTNTVAPANATSPVYAWYSRTSNGTTGGTLITGATGPTYAPSANSAGTLWYYGVITAGGATVTSSSAVQVTVRASPVITTQPVSVTVAASGNATFSISATDGGFPSLVHRWESMPSGGTWTTIAGATANSYSPTILTNATLYRCTVTNAAGSGVSSTSNAATLTVVQSPTITADTTPLDPSALAGATINLLVAATIPTVPAGTLTYQWQRRASSAATFAEVGAATNATLGAVAGTSGEQYRCILANTVNGVTAVTTSRTTTITVSAANPPVFTLQPLPVSIPVGTSATFTIAVTGVPTPTLQWSDSPDNVAFTPISGETSATYTTGMSSALDIGITRYYRCVATNTSGSVPSTSVSRTVVGTTTGIAYINFTSSTAGGAYLPKSVTAAWIQRGSTFIKTVGSWSGERSSSLVLWNSIKSGTDAVMGATRLSHRQIGNLQWSFLPRSTPDGTYTLWLESADDNPGPIGTPSTSSVPGANRTSLDFTITGGAVVETTGSGGGFTNLRIASTADPSVPVIGDATATVQDAGKISSCGSGALFALLCGFVLAAGMMRRRH